MPDSSKPRRRRSASKTPEPVRPLARVVNLLTRRSEGDLSATRLLAHDHQVVRALLRRLDDVDGRDGLSRRDIVGQVRRLLDVHARILDRVFIPTCRAIRDVHVHALLAESQEAHRIIRCLVREIGALSPFDERYEAKVAVLSRIVLREWAEEERDLFAEIERAWPPSKLEELGARLRQLKARLADR
jgi:hemerythrin HHE cation binding domain-containing protein